MTFCERKFIMLDYTMPICFIVPKHKDMAVHGKITSAGFFKVVNGRIETYGKSESLNMTPHKDDAHILEHFFGIGDSH